MNRRGVIAKWWPYKAVDLRGIAKILLDMWAKFCIFYYKTLKLMDLNYISGFFDADGYVTLVKLASAETSRSPVIGFTNTKTEILEAIKGFLSSEYNLKGHISSKKKAKEHHAAGQDLKYTGRVCFKLASLLASIHPKKSARIRLLLTEYDIVVKRNGRYSTEDLQKLAEFESRFLGIL